MFEANAKDEGDSLGDDASTGCSTRSVDRATPGVVKLKPVPRCRPPAWTPEADSIRKSAMPSVTAIPDALCGRRHLCDQSLQNSASTGHIPVVHILPLSPIRRRNSLTQVNGCRCRLSLPQCHWRRCRQASRRGPRRRLAAAAARMSPPRSRNPISGAVPAAYRTPPAAEPTVCPRLAAAAWRPSSAP